MPRLAILTAILLLSSLRSSRGQLQVGFYAGLCPRAEDIVRTVVTGAFLNNPSVAPALLRLHFHDCIVDGCDGSILVRTPAGQQENRAFGHQGLRGQSIIDDAKAQLELECPGVVSCADIVALAARDSVVLSNGPFYLVETGRRDGFVSSVVDASVVPEVSDPIEVLLIKFAQKGLTAQDLVVLTAAHTIGTTACFFMTGRLYNFQGTRRPDPSINPMFLGTLQAICPPGGNGNVRLAIDNGSGQFFDAQFFSNIRAGFAVLQSDAALYSHPATRPFVDFYAVDPASFAQDFALAMVKLGRIQRVTAGHVRRVCSSVV
ncbi:peroxidase 43-like isoform X2 [Wolffia australiana]